MRIFLMRHSKSCANHLRDEGIAHDQELRDPGLSVNGVAAARAYGPVLRKRLLRHGFDVRRATVASSTLRRAKETARLLFGREPVVVDQFTEHGAIPENTPSGRSYEAPSWPAVRSRLNGDTVLVGHGSFLTSLWPELTGKKRAEKLKNMDGILLEEDGYTEILAPRLSRKPDSCRVRDTRKLAVLSRMGAKFSRARTAKAKARKAGKTRRGTRKQRGGNSLPYYNPDMRFQYSGAAGHNLTRVTPYMVRPMLATTYH